MTLWIVQVFAVIILFGLFRAGYTHGWLATMPGPAWIEHGHLILLGLVPAFHWSVYLVWLVGLVAYVDDFRQHWLRAHGRPYYRSPLHVWAWEHFLARVYMWLGWD